jgi:hypothetical protein
MYPIDEGFLGEENGLWEYGIRFEAKTKHAQKDLQF